MEQAAVPAEQTVVETCCKQVSAVALVSTATVEVVGTAYSHDWTAKRLQAPRNGRQLGAPCRTLGSRHFGRADLAAADLAALKGHGGNGIPSSEGFEVSPTELGPLGRCAGCGVARGRVVRNEGLLCRAPVSAIEEDDP